MFCDLKNGNRYWVESHGAGEPIFLLHGFTGSAKNWEDVVPYFSDRFRVMVVDLPGHGNTSAFHLHSMEDFCLDLGQIIHMLGYSSVHLIGYSMGGRTALSFATQYPGKVRSLVLESASPGLDNELERKKRMAKDSDLAEFILNHPLEAFVDKWEDLPLFQSQRRLPVSKQAQIRKERLNQKREGLAFSLEVMGTGVMQSCWPYLQQLQFPVCIITGELDQKFVGIGKQIKKLLPNCTFQLVSDCGHAIHVEQAHFFGTIVNEFYLEEDLYDSRMD